MEKILIIEDELSIAKLLQYNLEKENYAVEISRDGEEGYHLALNNDYSMILLDLMLPSKDGIEIAKDLRRDKIDTPIIMLTAKDSEIDKVVGLEIGADDYVTKPFSPRELVARIKVVLKRSRKQSESSSQSHLIDEKITIDELDIYPNQYKVFVKGKQIGRAHV